MGGLGPEARKPSHPRVRTCGFHVMKSCHSQSLCTAPLQLLSPPACCRPPAPHMAESRVGEGFCCPVRSEPRSKPGTGEGTQDTCPQKKEEGYKAEAQPCLQLPPLHTKALPWQNSPDFSADTVYREAVWKCSGKWDTRLARELRASSFLPHHATWMAPGLTPLPAQRSRWHQTGQASSLHPRE